MAVEGTEDSLVSVSSVCHLLVDAVTAPSDWDEANGGITNIENNIVQDETVMIWWWEIVFNIN